MDGLTKHRLHLVYFGDVIPAERKFKMKLFRILGLLLALAVSQRAQAQTATITWTNTYQTMDGWGGEDWFGAASGNGGSSGYVLTSSQAAMFFSPSTGIGLEYIRTGNYACPRTGACTVSTSNVPDLVTLQEAVSNGALVQVDFSPPAGLKYTNDFAASTPGANGTCIPDSNWSAYATFVVQWIQLLNSNNVPVSAIAISNESNLNDTDTLGGCVWTGATLDSFIAGTLGPALTSASWNSTQATAPTIGLPQNSNWFDTDLYSACFNDSACSQYVGVAFGHGYNLGSVDGTDNGYCCHTATAPPSSTSGKRIWMTEVNGGLTYVESASNWIWDPSIADAMVWAHSIHDYLTVANASLWNYWELIDWCGGTTAGGCAGAPFNSGLTVSTGGGQTPTNIITSKRMYAIGNWSKFVRSGWVRVDTTTNPQSGVYVSAFKDTAAGNYAIVVINQNGSAVTQSFTLNGFDTTSVIPWVTSATLSLVQQSSVSVSNNAFSYSLPAQSITTFVGTTAGGSAGSPVAPPTSLNVSVK
jgi:glucuronoarabinoxylan endo-1,4-beta-xylanase